MPTVDEYISAVHHLVPAPVLLPQILPLLTRPNSDSSKIVDLISNNQSLTANVLRVCNSAYYSCGSQIDNLPQAVTRIGFHQLYDIVVSVTTSISLSGSQAGYCVEDNALWEHSVAVAVAAQLIARDAFVDQQVVFTAALLHNVGKIVLSPALAKMIDKVMYETDKNGSSSIGVESRLLGVNHAEVGARLLERWKLPQNLVSAVLHHHRPSAAKGHERLAACVNLGNTIAYFMGHGYGNFSLDLKARRETSDILYLSSEQIPQYMTASFEKLKQVKEVYNLK